MNDKDLKKLFDRHKAHPAFGSDFNVERACKLVASRIGYDTDETQPRYTVRDHVEIFVYEFTHSLLKPLSATVAVFLLVLGGGFTAVSASTQTLPGERLYPVKMAVEKAQLSLALSADARADLRVEFAGRRLEEMVRLAAMLDQTTPESVQLAANRFKTEVANIQEELHTEDASQKAFAQTVGRKVEIYSSTVATTGTDLPDDVRTGVEEILEETKDQVVEVFIATHEADQDEESARELDEALTAEIASVEVTYGADATVAIKNAQALREEGLYRRAFQVLKDFVFEAELKL